MRLHQNRAHLRTCDLLHLQRQRAVSDSRAPTTALEHPGQHWERRGSLTGHHAAEVPASART
jgi:hypothetical protein